jgi:hypothetical protein
MDGEIKRDQTKRPVKGKLHCTLLKRKISCRQKLFSGRVEINCFGESHSSEGKKRSRIPNTNEGKMGERKEEDKQDQRGTGASSASRGSGQWHREAMCYEDNAPLQQQIYIICRDL